MKLDAKFYGEIRKAKDDSIVPEDEYVVFLAKDNAFAAVLPHYFKYCVAIGCDVEQINAVEAMLTRLEEWRAAHPDRCKNPDAAGERLLDPVAPEAAQGRLPALEALRGIRKRLAQRRAPSVGTCAACGHQQDMMPSNQPMASGMAEAQWRCQACGGQIQVTFTMTTWTVPSPDDDIETLLKLVAGLRADPAPRQLLEEKDNQARVEPLNDCVAPAGSTAEGQRGEVVAAQCSCWIGRGDYGGWAPDRIACAVHGDAALARDLTANLPDRKEPAK